MVFHYPAVSPDKAGYKKKECRINDRIAHFLSAFWLESPLNVGGFFYECSSRKSLPCICCRDAKNAFHAKAQRKMQRKDAN
jgi:hypothetical protein